MPDWKWIVREKLGTLPLGNGRREEVIEELAEQLASAYEEARGEGMDEQEAMRSSIAQFQGWEKRPKFSRPSKVRAFRYGSKTVFSLPAAGRSG
jgi:hypothetical protein